MAWSHPNTEEAPLHLHCSQANNIRYISLVNCNVGNMSSNSNGNLRQHFPALDIFDLSLSDPTFVPVDESIQAPTFDPLIFSLSSEQPPSGPQNLIAPYPNFAPFDDSIQTPVLNPSFFTSSSAQTPVAPQEPSNSRDNADAPCACEDCNKTFKWQCDLK